MIEVTYRCSGCEATETVSVAARREVIQAGNALGWDLCVDRKPTIEGSAPDGWMTWDLYTLTTYCPDCWAEIEGGGESDASRRTAAADQV